MGRRKSEKRKEEKSMLGLRMKFEYVHVEYKFIIYVCERNNGRWGKQKGMTIRQYKRLE